MRILIAYMTHHGTTQKVVDRLAEGLGQKDTTVINLDHHHDPLLDDYDTVIIGGSIHIGQVQPMVKRFCEQNKDVLLGKRLGLFLCFMNKELAQQEFENAYPKELREHALAHGLFGGELLIDKMNLIERFMVKMIARETKSKSEINYAAIDQFIETLK